MGPWRAAASKEATAITGRRQQGRCRPASRSPLRLLPPTHAPVTRAALAPLQDRKASPLQRGGTLQGAAAAGKDASDKFKSMAEGPGSGGPVLQVRA